MKQKTWTDMTIKKNKPYKMSETTLRATWIDISDATTDNGGLDWHIIDLKCSNCGGTVRAYHTPWYCEWCGARMVKNETN